MAKKFPLAIAYDFDGTLAPGNMQERDFIPAIGIDKKSFWKEVNRLAGLHEADNILIYMNLMVERARHAGVPVRRTDIEKYGRALDFFPGVEPYSDEEGTKHGGWFDRITEYGKESGIAVEHFIISSGLREMIRASRIGKKFKEVYASSFMYDNNNAATWPALCLNYTTKTQYLFRINKGVRSVHDHSIINDYVGHDDRPIPFRNIMFVGDGETDIPCFRLVKDQGGHSVAVYEQGKRGAKVKSDKLLSEGRVNFASAADYRDGTKLDRTVKAVIDKIAADGYLAKLKAV